MPADDEDETSTTTDELETTTETELRGAAGASAAKKARKERDDAKRELSELRARFKRLEDAEKSEAERARAEADDYKQRFEALEERINSDQEQRTRMDHVRRAASEFADPEDAIAHLSLRGELADIEDEADAKRALKTLAKDKPYLLKTQAQTSPLDKVLNGGLPPGQAELNAALDPSSPKTGDEMYAMSDEEFLGWRRAYPDAYRKSIEGWTGNELAVKHTPTVGIRQ